MSERDNHCAPYHQFYMCVLSVRSVLYPGDLSSPACPLSDVASSPIGHWPVGKWKKIQDLARMHDCRV